MSKQDQKVSQRLWEIATSLQGLILRRIGFVHVAMKGAEFKTASVAFNQP